MRRCAPFALSIGRAAGVSAVIALLGNAIVLLGRRWNAADWTTLVGVPLLGASGSLLLRLRGWRWGDLGWRRPTVAARRAVPCSLLGAAPVAAAMSAIVWSERTGDVTVLNVVRLVVGTAVGEEIVHRGVVLATWLSTGASARAIFVANLTTFALWHVAGAADKGPAGVVVDVGGPAVLGVVLLWARLRYRSVSASAAFHGAGNLGGSAIVGR
ncbi:MAG: CPBP family intramembrane metalloprotease [Actinomycetota bacterium]|nr:CPBP family intramembrane metalloprotease [Actinomycetota bacterium]